VFLSLGSKPKKQPKRERTEEERTFRRRARYFLVTQVVAVLVFLSCMSSNDFSEVEVDDDDDDDDDDDEGFSYERRSIHFFDKFVFSLTIFFLVTIQSWTSL
jgi:metaxin